MTTAPTLELEVTEQGGMKRELAFRIPADIVTDALNEAYDSVAGSVRLPGFRPGKVPRQVVRSRFAEQVKPDVIQRLVPDYYRQALEQSGLQPLGEPEFGEIKLEEGQPLQVSVSFEVSPEIELKPYDGLSLSGTDLTVTDRDLEVAHKSLLESMATLEPAKKGAKAKDGDAVTIDFAGTIDGAAFDGGKGEGHTLTLGEGRFIPGFEEQIVGHKAGDVFDVNVTFPEDYQAENLAGKEAVFAVTVHDVKHKVLPDLDDDFARQLGDFDDLEALNATLREQIRTKREQDLRQMQRRQAFRALVESYDFEAPEQLLEEELSALVDTAGRLHAMQGGGESGFDADAARKEYREEAVGQARGRLIITEIAKVEGLVVSEEEIQGEFSRLAQEYQRTPAEIEQAVRSNPSELARMRSHLLHDKVLDLIVDRAEITIEARPDQEQPKAKAKAKKATDKKSTGKKSTGKKSTGTAKAKK